MSSNIATSSTPSYSAVLQQPSPLQKAPVGYFKSVPTNAPLVNPDGSFTLLNWRNTVSSLANKPFVGRVPPDCSSPNSLFLDRKANRISDKDILEVFAKDLLGTAFFPSEQFVQLTFKEADIYEKYLHNLSFTVKDRTYHLSPPKHIPRSSLTIHLHGLPILPKPTISKAIHEALSQYCNVQDIAPVLIKGTELITPKWDAVIIPIPDKQIPVHLNILDSSIALTWVNSSKICLRCHSQDHLNSDCPHRPPPRPRISRTYASLTNAHVSPLITGNQQSNPPHLENSTPVIPNINQDTNINTSVLVSETTHTIPVSTQNSLNSSIHAPNQDSMQTDNSSTENVYSNTNNNSFNSTADLSSTSHPSMDIDSSSSNSSHNNNDFQTVQTRQSKRNKISNTK